MFTGPTPTDLSVDMHKRKQLNTVIKFKKISPSYFVHIAPFTKTCSTLIYIQNLPYVREQQH